VTTRSLFLNTFIFLLNLKLPVDTDSFLNYVYLHILIGKAFELVSILVSISMIEFLLAVEYFLVFTIRTFLNN
jgi:hypothetical protein